MKCALRGRRPAAHQEVHHQLAARLSRSRSPRSRRRRPRARRPRSSGDLRRMSSSSSSLSRSSISSSCDEDVAQAPPSSARLACIISPKPRMKRLVEDLHAAVVEDPEAAVGEDLEVAGVRVGVEQAAAEELVPEGVAELPHHPLARGRVRVAQARVERLAFQPVVGDDPQPGVRVVHPRDDDLVVALEERGRGASRCRPRGSSRSPARGARRAPRRSGSRRSASGRARRRGPASPSRCPGGCSTRSACTESSAPGYCTFTATSVPSGRRPRCTWPSDAAATASWESSAKSSSGRRAEILFEHLADGLEAHRRRRRLQRRAAPRRTPPGGRRRGSKELTHLHQRPAQLAHRLHHPLGVREVAFDLLVLAIVLLPEDVGELAADIARCRRGLRATRSSACASSGRARARGPCRGLRSRPCRLPSARSR